MPTWGYGKFASNWRAHKIDLRYPILKNPKIQIKKWNSVFLCYDKVDYMLALGKTWQWPNLKSKTL